MKLSIIIPVYNEEGFLKRCLDSVYSNEDVEVIIVNDGSTDKSEEIINEYQGKFEIMGMKTNWGVSFARNLGLASANGDYVTFLDSDDSMSEKGISNILNVIGRYNDPIIQFNHFRVYEGKPTDKHIYNMPAGIYQLENLPRKYAVVWNKIYRRDFLQVNGISFKIGQQFDEDRQFNYQCFAYCDKIRCVNEFTINKYFDNEQSICHTLTRKKLLDASASLEELLRDRQPVRLERVIRNDLARKWKSRDYKDEFGGE